MPSKRILIHDDPFLAHNADAMWRERGLWLASWVTCPGASPPFVAAFRKQFTLTRSETIRIHVSADERYELFIDGERVGRGPERSAPELWFFESFDLALDAGEHTIVARVWHWGEHAPQAQMTVTPGFILAAEGDWQNKLSTGLSEWHSKLLDGYSFKQFFRIPWKGGNTFIDGRTYPWGVERGAGDDWVAAKTLRRGMVRKITWESPPEQQLAPALLPPQLSETKYLGVVRQVSAPASANTFQTPVLASDHMPGAVAEWQVLLRGEGPITLPPNTLRRVIVDLEEYYVAYASLITSGGRHATVRVRWAEALNHSDNLWHGDKRNRDEIEGKYFLGNGDGYMLDGGAHRTYAPLWWSAGRYVELLVETKDDSVTLESISFTETHYPLTNDSTFEASNAQLNNIVPILVRGIQMSAHECYFDSPHWEEIMYLGDTRLETLCTYVMSRDERLPRKALRMFDVSRLPSGLTQSRYPCSLVQVIPPFSLWWCCMVRDYALWRGDPAVVRGFMAGVRANIEGYLRYVSDTDGLLHAPEGWNFIDWVPAWDKDAGIPPDGVTGVSGALNWQFIYALSQVADLERMLEEGKLASRNEHLAQTLSARATQVFWDDRRGLFSDDLAHTSFSEHTQCMAILSGQLDKDKRARVAESLLTASDLHRATIYFQHYLFETFREIGHVDALLDRMQLWFDLKINGLKTPVESPEPTRSDCHGWGSHPLYHYYASILGIRPAAMGFKSVEVRPQLGGLVWASGRLVHPTGEGEIVIDVHQRDGRLHGRVILPDGVDGVLVVNGEQRAFEGAIDW
jgi:hypothetical protein